MKLKTILLVAGGAAVCAATGGLAAPAIGAAVGSTFMGLSGAAATSAGLAALGGGSLAAGGAGMAGGTTLIAAVTGTVGALGTAGASAIASGKKAETDLNEAQNLLYELQKSENAKQAVIIELQHKLDAVKYELDIAKGSADASEERIFELEEKLQLIMQLIKDERARLNAS